MENLRIGHSVWLVNTLLNYKKLKLREIDELWRRHIELSGGMHFTRNNLYRAIEAARSQFGVIIECDLRDEYRYYIVDNQYKKATELLISSQAISQAAIGGNDQLRHRMLLDEVPSGLYHLSTVVEAMRQSCVLEMTYQKFADSEPYTCHIQPYCVKMHEQRWYILGVKDHSTRLQTFALDRIHQLIILPEEHFHYPEDFAPQSYFAYALGVYAGPDLVPESIVLRVASFWRQYLVTLPLHASQHEVERHADYSLFSYTLAVTPDLVNRLLSFGPNIEVIAPLSLREQLSQRVAEMYHLYQKKP